MTNKRTDLGDEFGFGVKQEIRDKISGIKPALPPETSNIALIDAAGDRNGFISREAQPQFRHERTVESRVQFSMRFRESSMNKFKRFCDEQRLSYPEAVEELMKQAGIL